jgi:hypothetical protein
MSREKEDARGEDRAPAEDRHADDARAQELDAEPQDQSLKVHGDKYERALDESRGPSERGA